MTTLKMLSLYPKLHWRGKSQALNAAVGTGSSPEAEQVFKGNERMTTVMAPWKGVKKGCTLGSGFTH